MGDYVLFRDTRPNSPKEWGRIVGVERLLPGYPPDARLDGKHGTPCYIVEYISGVQRVWPIVDDDAQYDFR